MGAIYWFVFTQIFGRGVGEEPYIVFLISALLPWVWFNASVTDFTRAFNKDARLVRSTAIPRSIWVNRIVLSKGVEFLCSLPVLVGFAVFAGAQVGWGLLWFPLAVILQAMLLVGLGLIVAPLCVLWKDLERTTRLVLRALFYASPVIYGVNDLPARSPTSRSSTRSRASSRCTGRGSSPSNGTPRRWWARRVVSMLVLARGWSCSVGSSPRC